MHVRLGTVVAVLLSLACPSLADIIHLANGGEIRGTVIERTPEHITIRTAGGVLTVRTADVIRVEVESGPDRLISEARMLSSAGHLDEALVKLRAAADEGASRQTVTRLTVSFLKAEASRLETDGRLAEAHEVLLRAGRIAPDDADLKQAAARVKSLRLGIVGGSHEALLAMRSGDHLRAVKIFERLLRESPGSREGLSELVGTAYLNAARTLSNDRNAEALRMLEHAEEFSPKLHDEVTWLRIRLRYLLARELRLEKKPEEAFAISKTLMRASSDLPFVRYQHACILTELKRYPEGRKELLIVVPEHLRADVVVRGSRGYGELLRLGAKVADDSFRDFDRKHTEEKKKRAKVEEGPEQTLSGVFFDVVHKNEYLARKVQQVARAQTERILREIGRGGETPWRKAVPIFLMANRATYLAKSGMPEWSVGMTHMDMIGDGLAVRCIAIYQTTPDLLKKTLPHEVAHVVMSSLIRHSTRTPLAIHEGFAVSMEPGFDRSAHTPLLLYSRFTGTLIPLRELFMQKRVGARVRLFYAESASIVGFLVDLKGWETFFRFAEAVNRRNLDLAVGKFYPYRSVEELEKAWREKLGG